MYRLVTSKESREIKINTGRSKIKADGQDLSHIAIQLVDEDGYPNRVCLW